jgi:hypothetical protein
MSVDQKSRNLSLRNPNDHSGNKDSPSKRQISPYRSSSYDMVGATRIINHNSGKLNRDGGVVPTAETLIRESFENEQGRIYMTNVLERNRDLAEKMDELN